MPDDQLMRLAADGQLRDPEILEKQVLRMLADDRIQTGLVENFAGQWLQVRNLASATPDADVFPEFSDSLRTAMAAETNLFFESIIRDDRNILDLLDADFTYLNEELARHYNIDGITGDQFRLVLLDDARRGGVLTQASFLTITSNPTRTSPVKRGKWVMEQILGTPPPLPPANVPPLEEEESAVDPTAPLRKKMEQHRADPNCSVCHVKMDAIGFAFENFDATGQWREKDGRFDIEPAGALPDGRAFADAIDLKGILLEDSDQFTRNLARQMLTYALGRGLEFYDRCAIDDIVAEVQSQNYRFSSLVLAIVQSDPFQRRRAAETHAD